MALISHALLYGWTTRCSLAHLSRVVTRCVPLARDGVVAGPFKLNGVPLRRLNQAYVIATSKKVDVSGVRIPDSVNDEFFKRTKATGRFKSEEEFFAATKTVRSRVWSVACVWRCLCRCSCRRRLTLLLRLPPGR